MHITIEPTVLYFGTPVALISTLNEDGGTNLSPMSSLWALGDTYALGLGSRGHAFANIARVPELVINLPEAPLVAVIERMAPTTGSNPVPEHKRDRYRHESDKWSLAGLTPIPSETIRPQRVEECGVQMEARVVDVRQSDGSVAVFAHVERVHARIDLVMPGTSYIDLSRWKPLYYTFRHYFAQGEEVGKSFKADQ